MSQHTSSNLVFSGSQLAGNIWRKMIEPHPAIQEPERRRRARLLSALLLVILLMGGLSIILMASGVINPPKRPQDIEMTAVAVVLLGGAYGLSRSRYMEQAAACTLFIKFPPKNRAIFSCADERRLHRGKILTTTGQVFYNHVEYAHTQGISLPSVPKH